MNALLYRPAPKRSVVVAFGAAAAIHVSALAFSPNHPVVFIPAPGMTDIEIESPAVDPEPPPQGNETPPPLPEPSAAGDFTEAPQPTPRRSVRSSEPIRPVRIASPRSQPRNGKLFALQAPKPNYPYEARQHHITGSGAAILDVDPLTGSVIHANLIESTGSPILDNSAMSAFRRWRFKTGTPSPVKVPFTFTMFGAQL